VLAEFFQRPVDESNAATRASDTTTILDATAAHTLALLDERLRVLLIGTCSSLVTTDAAFRDAVAARDALRLHSTMTVGWDTTTDRPIVNEVSEEEAAALAAKAEQLVSVMATARREPHPTLKHFPEPFDPAQPSLGLVDLAKTSDYALWSDDRVLRRLAASMGVATFGTIALIEALLRAGKIDAEEFAISLSTLLSNYYSDIPFRADVYTLASQMDGPQLGGAAHSLSRPATWSDPEATFEFALSLLRATSASAPQDVRTVCGLAASGLLAVAVGDPEGCANNLAILLSRCVREAWCTSAALPFVLAGVRDAMQAAAEATLRDRLEVVLRALHDVAVRRLGDVGAKAFALELVSQCGNADKQTAARVILTAPRR
jgi:predicted nucleic acid-binding protein